MVSLGAAVPWGSPAHWPLLFGSERSVDWPGKVILLTLKGEIKTTKRGNQINVYEDSK